MRSLTEARRAVLDAMPRLPTVRVPVGEAAGLVLAEAVTAPHDVPPFPNSAMDGYAVRAADLAAGRGEFVVVEDVPAGRVATRGVESGTAVKIMTGAPMPVGADTVVKVEDTVPLPGGRVRVVVPPAGGANVRPAGGDLAAGAPVFPAGVRLEAPHLAVLASLGVAPLVRRRPVVAILSTGDEVVPADTAVLEPGKIRDSNRVLLRRVLEGLGVAVRDGGIVPDDAGRLEAALAEAASSADAVITSGGVSMGEYDLVKTVLARLGSVGFWKVAMQPGKPFAFGTVAGTPFFGLPGNPVSSFVSFEQLVRPALLTMMGAERIFRPQVVGVFTEQVRTDPRRTVFLRAAVAYDPARGWTARRSGAQGSNVLSALAAADAFAVVPVGVEDVAAGDRVGLEMFRWPEARTRQEVLG